jgi:hypothetical protein
MLRMSDSLTERGGQHAVSCATEGLRLAGAND